MSKANDLEGRQDMGGKHGGQAGMPKPDRSAAQQGLVLDEKGQEQPADKSRAQHVSRKDRGNDPPGDPKQVVSFGSRKEDNHGIAGDILSHSSRPDQYAEDLPPAIRSAPTSSGRNPADARLS
jgi:hypothetical protein